MLKFGLLVVAAVTATAVTNCRVGAVLYSSKDCEADLPYHELEKSANAALAALGDENSGATETNETLVDRAAKLTFFRETIAVEDLSAAAKTPSASVLFKQPLNTKRIRPVSSDTFLYAVSCDRLPPYLTCDLFRELIRATYAYALAWVNVRSNASEPVLRLSEMEEAELLALRPERFSRSKPFLPVLHVRFNDFGAPKQPIYPFVRLPMSEDALAYGSALTLDISIRHSFHFADLEDDLRPLRHMSDLRFNTVYAEQGRKLPLRFSRSLTRGCEYSFMHTLLHEAFHSLGVNHATFAGSMMYAYGFRYRNRPPPNRVLAGYAMVPNDVYMLRYLWDRTNYFTPYEHVTLNAFWDTYRRLMVESRERKPVNLAPEHDEPTSPSSSSPPQSEKSDLRYNDQPTNDRAERVNTFRENLAKVDPFDASVQNELLQRIRDALLRTDRSLIDRLTNRTVEKLYETRLVGKDNEIHRWFSDMFAQDTADSYSLLRGLLFS
jgi:hypothetical protein